MQLKFIVSHEGLELGPFTEEEIRQMVGTNQLLPIDYLYDEGKQDWILINERFDLKAAPQGPAAPDKKVAANPAFPELGEAPPPQNQVVRRRETSKFSTKENAPATASPTLGVGTPLPSPAVVKIAPPTAAPQPAAPAPASQPTAAQNVDAGKVQFSGGIGTVSLKQLRAGRVVLKLKDCSSPNVSLPTETVINVQAGPAKMIGWEVPSDSKAGDEVVVNCWAKDAYDNITTNFDGALELVVKGEKTEKVKATFTRGVATVRFKWTKAEAVSLELSDFNHTNLGMPAPKTLTVKAGPAMKLIVESPAQTVVGENLPVTVKAVDAYGNLATDFKGEIAVGMSIETQKAG